MTFYNVLSALLFIGALRVLLVSIENVSWQDIFASGCFAMIVFNDMLSFSLAVEINKEIQYKARLMLIDLANFLLLALALVIMSPSKNLFDVPLPNISSRLGSSTFWLLLLLYWLFLMLWTYHGRGVQHPRLVMARSMVGLVFLIRWLLSLNTTDLATLYNAIAFVCILIYLAVIRPKLRAKYSKQPAVRNEQVAVDIPADLSDGD
jgi:uncharacterized membrane protein (DUF373 family)